MAKLSTARDESGSDDDIVMTTSKKSISTAHSVSSNKGRAAPPSSDEEGSDEEEEEYEIEAILESRLGMFPEGRTGYLVKWKGYGEEHNSWVDENDALGAKELIDDYWSRRPKKGAGPRKSEPKPKPKPAVKTRKEKEDSMEVESVSVPAKKRGRPSKAREPSEEEEEEEAPKKKSRKSTAKGANGKRTGARDADDEEDEDDGNYTSMKKWKDAESWEHLVQEIDTVERTKDGSLCVYFTLKNGKGHGRESGDVCKQKMPLMLIDFYQRNLRWKSEEDAMEE